MNILTFDIEEWYVYEQYPKGGKDYYLPIINDYLDRILELLDKYNLKATFFCLGVIARKFPHIIRNIESKGHEIGCHSDKHKLITTMIPEEFEKDTHLAIDSIEQVIGKKINYYRAPAFTITDKTKWALDILVNEGITCDSSIFPAKHSLGGFISFPANQPTLIKLKHGSIIEFPISSVSIFGSKVAYCGGGYFRLFPYSIIKKWIANSDYSMAYFHIRDLDKKQKRVISMRYFLSYYGINGAFNKFESLLNDFTFLSLGDAIKHYYDDLPVITLK